MEILVVVLVSIGALFFRALIRNAARVERRRKPVASPPRQGRILPHRPRPVPTAAAAPSQPAESWSEAISEGIGDGIAAEIERGQHSGGDQHSGWRADHARVAREESHPLSVIEHGPVERGEIDVVDVDDDDSSSSADSDSSWSWDDD